MASERDGLRQRAKRAKGRRELDKRMLTGMANSVRAEVHVLLTERAASMNEVSRDLGIDYQRIRYEFDKLKAAGLIAPVGEERARGAVEIYYRAVTRACIDDMEWPSVPDTLKRGMRGSLLDNIANDAIEAIQAGVYDSLEGAHMSRTPGLVDDLGWDELRDWLSRCLEGVIKIFDINAQRLADKDAVGTAVAVAILGYPSTSPGRRVDPRPNAPGHRPGCDSTPDGTDRGLKAKKKRGRKPRSDG